MIVGNYQLTNPNIIVNGLRSTLAGAGYDCGRIDVRSPDEHAQAYAEILAQYPDGWHYETECVGRHFAVWSDRAPTQVMFNDGRLLDAKDGDVILIDNLEARHRPPDVARWFARAWHVKRIQ